MGSTITCFHPTLVLAQQEKTILMPNLQKGFHPTLVLAQLNRVRPKRSSVNSFHPTLVLAQRKAP